MGEGRDLGGGDVLEGMGERLGAGDREAVHPKVNG